MRRIVYGFFVLSLSLMTISNVALAQTEDVYGTKDEAKEDAATKEQLPDTPITQWRSQESALVESLSDDDKQLYFIIRNKQGVVRAIRMAKEDIGKASQQCGQKNPDMQDNMMTRYDQWTSAVDPLLKTADAFIAEEIKTQSIVEPKVFEDMLDLNEEAVEYQESLVEKQYVTTKDACEKLLKSMDNTEEDMLRLMQDVLLPSSVINERPQ